MAVSAEPGGPVLYAVLSPLKAVGGVAAAAALSERDALDARAALGLAWCVASAGLFVVRGRRESSGTKKVS